MGRRRPCSRMRVAAGAEAMPVLEYALASRPCHDGTSGPISTRGPVGYIMSPMQAFRVMCGCAGVAACALVGWGQSPRINEFLTINDGGYADEDRAYPSWIEIHNAGEASVDLAGWHLTDDATNLVKWTFPPTNLQANAYMVVFASDKDRAIAGQPLHTNFKLSSQGEYLALVAPDGQTIATQFAPAYPRQRTNISAGPPGPDHVSEPVPEGSVVRWHVPQDDSLGTAWIAPGFSDANWFLGESALGFDTSGSAEPVLSVDFNDRDGGSTAAGFTGFVLDSVGGSTLPQSGAVTRAIGPYGVTVRPVGGVAADDRNRTTPTDGGLFTESALLRDFIFAVDTASNNGLDVEVTGLTSGRYYQVEIWSFDSGSTGSRVSDWSVNGELAVDDYTFNGSVLPVSNGQYRITCTVAADETGRLLIEGRREDVNTSHAVFLNALRISPAVLLREIRTDTGDAMLGHNATLYARWSFVLDDAASVTGCTLRIGYDDGFVAWLNGTEIARRHAPAAPAWNSTATAAQSNEAALVFEDVAVSPALLDDGVNVLAVQGLNVAADDADFFLLPRIETRGPPSMAVCFFQTPTPGSANAAAFDGVVTDTHFSVDRGLYSNGFAVAISCNTAGTQIRYTLNGDAPTATTGIPYTGPVPVNGTAVLRACAFRTGWIPPDVDTLTYVYPEQVALQPRAPAGWPSTWGYDSEVNSYDGAGNGTVPSDYEMDPNVVSNTLPGYGVTDALRALPILSVSLAPDGFLGASAGIYSHPRSAGDAWERPCALEFMERDVTNGFHINAGIRIHGNSSRRPYRLQKHGFRVAFRGEYGASKLEYALFPGCGVDSFDRLVLRPFFTDGWGLVSWDPSRYRPDDSVSFRDVWMKESQRAMGHPSGAGLFVHLFFNGLYWGVYNLTERLDERFCAAHFGGIPEDYDILADFNELKAGTRAAWDAVQAMAAAGLSTPAAYAEFAEQVDIVNLADYMLLHFLADAEDWPHHNWYAMRNRVAPGSKWRFFVWDQEIVLDNHGINRTGSSQSGTPAALFHALRQNTEFRMLFADRVHTRLRSGGALGLDSCRQRWNALAGALDKAIVAESARWGDTADETPYGNTEGWPGVPVKREYTREADWLPTVAYVRDTYLPSLYAETNTFAILPELRAAGLYPSTAPPVFSLPPGLTSNGSLLSISAPTGAIYFTFDGADPRAPVTGDPAGFLYTSHLVLTQPVTVKARARSPAGEWSALSEAAYVVGVVPTPQNLVISEIMYNPFGTSEDGEFIELWNPSSDYVDLSGVAFVFGIEYQFAAGQFLAPGARVLLVKNQPAFESLYGTGLPVAGEYELGLDNNGEPLVLVGPDGPDAGTDPDILHAFSFDDEGLWPLPADGEGYSLTYMTGATDPSDPLNWRISVATNGSPGSTDAVGFSGDPHADLDLNGRADLLDHAIPGGRIELVRQDGAFWLFYDRRIAADDVVCRPEYSGDLYGWTPMTAATHRASGMILPGGLWRETWHPQSPDAPRQFYRIEIHRR